MTQLWTNDYNELVKDEPEEWQINSRQNYYAFHNKNGEVTILNLLRKYKVASVIDYGCGNGNAFLKRYEENIKNIVLYNYDPFVDKYKNPPESPADMVICFNVLNVIETELFDNVMEHITSLCTKVVVCNIRISGMYSREAEWYIERFSRMGGFKIEDSFKREKSLYVLLVRI